MATFGSIETDSRPERLPTANETLERCKIRAVKWQNTDSNVVRWLGPSSKPAAPSSAESQEIHLLLQDLDRFSSQNYQGPSPILIVSIQKLLFQDQWTKAEAWLGRAKDDSSATVTASVTSLDQESSNTLICRHCVAGSGQPWIAQDAAEWRQHFRSKWHAWNARRRQFHLAVVDELAFDEILSDVSESDSDASDNEESRWQKLLTQIEATVLDDDDNDSNDKSKRLIPGLLVPDHLLPFVFFQRAGSASVFGLYKRIFSSPSRDPLMKKRFDDPTWLGEQLARLRVGNFSHNSQQRPHWTLIMWRSGYFAAAVFDIRSMKCLQHKALQRYTTRRKQGKSQSTSDKMNGKASSAGSSLRRHNEQMLQQEIHQLLTDWQPLLEASDLIWMGAGDHQWRSLMEKFSKDDERIRAFPFTTRRPTFKELEEAFLMLTQVMNLTVAPLNVKLPEFIPVKESPKKEEKKEKKEKKDLEKPSTLSHKASLSQKLEVSSPSFPEIPPRDKDLEERLQQLFTACHLGQLDHLTILLQDENNLSLINERENWPLLSGQINYTLLQAAAVSGNDAIVSLLMNAGANPELSIQIHDESSHENIATYRTAYDVAENKACRDAMRRFMASFPDQWNYTIAHIPSPLTEEMEAKQRQKKKQRAQDQKTRRKAEELQAEQERQQELAMLEAARQAELKQLQLLKEAEEKRARDALTAEREKRARAAEMRLKK